MNARYMASLAANPYVGITVISLLSIFSDDSSSLARPSSPTTKPSSVIPSAGSVSVV